MAKVISIIHHKNSIDCLISGALGDRIYCIRNGVQYSRSRPVHIFNPKSEAQLAHRAKFAATIKFLKPLTDFIRSSFKNEHVAMSPFNLAMSYNLKNAMSGSYPNYAIDFSMAQVSHGTLREALNPKVNLLGRGLLEFSWLDNSNNANCLFNDRVMLVVYNIEKQEAETVFYGNTREQESQVITLPLSFEGDTVQCYIAFQNANRRDVSNSQYLGSLVVK